MNKVLLNSILVLGVFFINGCSIKEYKLFQTETKKQEEITKISEEDYEKEATYENKIAPNDRLSITVYVQSGQGSQQMSSILTTRSNTSSNTKEDDIGILVTQKGTVRLPLIGSVELVGLTEDEASEKLIEMYKLYIKNPYVKTEIKNQRVIVIGEVKKPGVVSVTNGTMTVIEAIAQSGDLTDLAARNNVKIIRGDLRNPTVRTIDIANIVALNESSLFLRPNDIIYVQPRNLKGYNKAFDEIMPFWNMLSSILDPFVKRKQILYDYDNEQTSNNQISNDEIDLKDLFKTIMKYKYIIAIIAMIFSILSAIFAYTKPSIYSSFATIELQEDSNRWSPDDALKKAFTGGSVNVENQIEILKSKSLADRAAKNLSLGTRYFTVKNYRLREYYQNSPFIVIDKVLDDTIYGTKFNLIPIDEDSFRLEIKPISKFSKRGILALLGVQPFEDYELISYDQVHKYNEDIVSQWFTLNITKLSPLENEEYSFSFVHPSSLSNYFADLSVSQVSKLSSILRVSINDTVSLRAKDLLNSLFKAYLEQEIERKSEVANLSLDFIDNQLEEINAKLKVSESDLESYKESNDVIILSDKAKTVSSQLVEYESKIQELDIEENIMKNLFQYISNNQNLAGLSVGSITFADPALTILIKSLHEQASQKETLLLDYTELHPDVVKLNQTISTLRRQIIASLKNNLKQLEQRKKSLNDLIFKFKKSLETLPKQERELTRLTRHFSVNEKVYSYLLEKRAETAILRSSTISNARVLDEALNYPIPVKPKRVLIVLVGLILGIIVGLAYAFLREFFNNTIKNTEEIEKFSSIPIYGVIPFNKSKKTTNIFLEAFKSIRTNLQFLPQNESSRVISVTSSVSGEGKTTIVAKLSEVIAQTQKKTIVLDLDLRKASVHKEFNLPNNVGMSNYLTGQNSLEEVIKKSENEFVDIITTGPLPPNPSELILTEKMKNLLEELKKSYDYVIIDTPPVGLVSNALILMNYSDITFTIVRASYTRKEFIKNLDRLAKEHSHNHVGMILNGVEIGDKYGYGYGVSYGYGYGNGKYYKNRT